MKEPINYTLSLKLKREKVFFGPGVLHLLQGIVANESINAAAKELGMSYNKAWRILTQAEKELGFKLIKKNIGGSNGGGSTVTKSGQRFMEKYLLFQQRMYLEADACFQELFDELIAERQRDYE